MNSVSSRARGDAESICQPLATSIPVPDDASPASALGAAISSANAEEASNALTPKISPSLGISFSPFLITFYRRYLA